MTSDFAQVWPKGNVYYYIHDSVGKKRKFSSLCLHVHAYYVCNTPHYSYTYDEITAILFSILSSANKTAKVIEKCARMIEENTCVHFYKQNGTASEAYNNHFIVFYRYGKK